jgi:hypothetical protein
MKSMVGLCVLASAQAADNGVLDIDDNDGCASLYAHSIKIATGDRAAIRGYAPARFVAAAARSLICPEAPR